MMWEYSNGGFKYIIDSFFFFFEKKYMIEFFVCVLISITVYLKKKKKECLSHIGYMCLVPGYVMYYELNLYYFCIYSNKYYYLLKKKKIQIQLENIY